jgi:tight adherence protein B
MVVSLSCCAISLFCWPGNGSRGRLVMTERSPSFSFFLRSRLLWFLLVVPAVPIFVLCGPGFLIGLVLLVDSGRCQLGSLRASRKDGELVESMAKALGTIISELRVGLHPAAAINSALEDASTELTAKALHVVATSISNDVAPSVKGLAGGRSVELLLRAWTLTKRHGLPLVEVLESVRRDLIANARLIERGRASMAGARSSAAILALLPLLGLVFGQLMGAEPLRVLTHNLSGQLLCLVGCLLVWCGVRWSARLSGQVYWC